MIAINHTLISEDIFDKKFVCDLNACKGECCVSGDSGAPLDKKELKILDKIYDSKTYTKEEILEFCKKYKEFFSKYVCFDWQNMFINYDEYSSFYHAKESGDCQ